MSVDTWLASGGLVSAAVAAVVGAIGMRNAARAYHLAEDANERAENAEKRATERRNVRWEITATEGSTGPGPRGRYGVSVANRGLDTAYEVTITLEAPFSTMARKSFVVLRTDKIGDVATEWYKPGWLQNSPSMPVPVPGPPENCTVRIAWRSEHGVWDEHVIIWPG